MEATGDVGRGGRGPTGGGGGSGPGWHLGLCRSEVLLQLLQAGRGTGWRGSAKGRLGRGATGQLGAVSSQRIQRDVRVLWLQGSERDARISTPVHTTHKAGNVQTLIGPRSDKTNAGGPRQR